MIGSLVTTVAGLIGKVVDRTIPDPKQAAELKAQLQTALYQLQQTELQGAVDIIKTEAGSEHKLTAIWRPILMLVIVAIVANNFIIAPYAEAIFDVSVHLPLPDQLWELMTVGVGGYIGGRSLEKFARSWKESK